MVRLNIYQMLFGILVVMVVLAGLIYSFETPARYLAAVLDGVEAVFFGAEKSASPIVPSPAASFHPAHHAADRIRLSREGGDFSGALRLLEDFPRSSQRYQDLAVRLALMAGDGGALRAGDLLARLQSGENLSRREWGAVEHDLASQQAVIGALRQAAADPDFHPELLRFTKGEEASKERDPVAAALEHGVDLLCLNAFAAQRAGRDSAALGFCANAARLAQAFPVARIDMQQGHFPMMQQALRTWSTVVDAQTTPRSLLGSLQEMTNLSVQLRQQQDQFCNPVVRDLMARLAPLQDEAERGALRTGSAEDLLARYVEASERAASLLPTDDPRREQMERRIRQEVADAKALVRAAGEEGDLLDRQKAAERAVQAQVDILRLQTARRIHCLSSGEQEGDGLAALAPRYLAFLPNDPFTRQEFRVHPESGRIYSVGPDGEDGGGEVAYDPTNGAMSAGDVFLQ